MPATSAEVRQQLVTALALDLVGPSANSDLCEETLDERPSRWYLCGYLVPLDADETQKSGSGETLDEIGDGGGADDAGTPETEAAKTSHLPSSIGLSFLVPSAVERIVVTARFGDYCCRL